jgi:proton glutamate symport protein
MDLKKLSQSLTFWIFVALVAGALVGLMFPSVAKNMDVFSKIFLKLIKTIVAPLLFSTLIIGIAGHADMKQVGRMGWKSIVYFEIVTTLALLFGLLAANWTRPGDNVNLNTIEKKGSISIAKSDWHTLTWNSISDSWDKAMQKAPTDSAARAAYREQLVRTLPDTMAKYIPLSKEKALESGKQDWKEIVLHTFPENIAKSVADGQVLQIVVFSIFFALGLAMVPNKQHKHTMLEWTESLAEVMFKFTKLVMYFAPLGVFGAMAYAVGSMGTAAFAPLLKLLLTVYLSLFAFLLFVLVPVCLLFKIKIGKFIKAITEPVSIAFGTASSEAALASAMQKLEAYGVPRKFVSFVLPTGMSFNLDGSTLYLATAAIFVAQAQGVELTIGQQILMLLTLMLTSKGVAGVARASLVILMGTIAMFGLSDTPVYLILAVDVLMDMARTGVNMLGNCLATVVVAKWEGEFED